MSFWAKYPRVRLPIHATVCTLFFALALPVAIALFPQESQVSSNECSLCMYVYRICRSISRTGILVAPPKTDHQNQKLNYYWSISRTFFLLTSRSHQTPYLPVNFQFFGKFNHRQFESNSITKLLSHQTQLVLSIQV